MGFMDLRHGWIDRNNSATEDRALSIGRTGSGRMIFAVDAEDSVCAGGMQSAIPSAAEHSIFVAVPADYRCGAVPDVVETRIVRCLRIT
jgi:hypothetical protein